MGRVVAAFAAVLACARIAVGAEASAGATSSTPSPIEAAKRDYDAFKAANFSYELQKLELPKTATPELHLENPSAGELILPSQNPKDKAKAATQRRGQPGTNWLVDAMLGDKDKAAKPGSAETSLTGDAEASDTEETGGLKLTDSSANKSTFSKSDRQRVSERALAGETTSSRVANPLDGFLAGWMTPGDYQLLKAAPEAGRGDAPATANLTGSAVGPDAGGLRAPGLPTSGPGANAPSFEPRVNPYLSGQAPTGDLGFNAPVLSGPPAAPASPPPPVTPVAPVVETPAPKPTSAAVASEVSKSRDDAKYFPQLKRF